MSEIAFSVELHNHSDVVVVYDVVDDIWHGRASYKVSREDALEIAKTLGVLPRWHVHDWRQGPARKWTNGGIG